MLVEARKLERDGGEYELHIAALPSARTKEAGCKTILCLATLRDRVRDGRLPSACESVDPKHGHRSGDIVDRLVRLGGTRVF